MRIQVRYCDGRVGMVKPLQLDKLLNEKHVNSFLRSDGWVVVGRDVMRKRRCQQIYDGKERRVINRLKAPLKQEPEGKSLQAMAWVIGPLILISILLSGLL